jgi:hypothetical protein
MHVRIRKESHFRYDAGANPCNELRQDASFCSAVLVEPVEYRQVKHRVCKTLNT